MAKRKRQRKINELGDDEAQAKPKAKRTRPPFVDGLERKAWAPDASYDGAKLKNVHFTEEEDEALLRGVRLWAEENGKDFQEVCDQLKTETPKTGAFSRIAQLADLKRRRVWSMVCRIRRILWGGHRWTPSELEILVDEASTSLKPSFNVARLSWKQISLLLNVHPLTCRDKYRDLCAGKRKKGPFSEQEDWRLRMAICETTNSLLPTSSIPWTEVCKWLPHRGWRTVMQRWYTRLMPRLLAYEDKYGFPIEQETFLRLLVRKLQKTTVSSAKEVEWTSVNTWWSADMNRRKWRILSNSVPRALDDASFKEKVQHWFEVLDCAGHKKRDRKLLKCALATIEREAQEMDEPQ
ncbi:unnamed protein product [Durusdinium trenchii]|uniref:Uncharacterized protein n=1 Tax=Durusdinium trenchii TaxID=1381693 RepID=A0ABP0KZ23_9DINO